MLSRLAVRIVLAALPLLATTGAAVAQSSMCRAYRAELASLDRGGRDGGARQAYAAAAAQYSALGCGGFSFFGANPQCAALSQRMNAARQAYYAPSHGSESRRQQLMAAISAYCGPGDDVRRIQGPEEDEARRQRRATEGEPRPVGGSRLVCVRSCDGYFFPLSGAPEGRNGANEMCQALCPGAQTAAYRMPLDGEIQQAVSLSGRAYSALPAALRYQKGADSSCSCRAQGQSWLEALRKAESMVERRKGDIYVTAAKAEELSRPKTTRIAKKVTVELAKAQTARPEAGPATTYTSSSASARSTGQPENAAALKAPVPTEGKESAGIGPKVIEADKALGKEVGEKKDVEGGGSRKTVRIIAPDVVPVPEALLP